MIKKISGINEIRSFINKCFINLDTQDLDNLVIVGIKTRGEYLGKRIVKLIEDNTGKDVPFGTLDITLYRDDFRNKKNWPKLKKTDIPHDIENKDVVLVDDVIYTGRTARAALNSLMDFGRPSSVRLFVLVDRGNRELPIQPDIVGINVEVKENENINVYINEIDSKEEVVLTNSDGIS